MSAPGGGKDAEGAKSSIFAITKGGSAETVYTSEDRMIYDLLVRSDDTLLAATGGKGRLLSIDMAKQVTVVTDSPEEQMTRMVAAPDAIFVAGSNQGRVYKLLSQQAQTGNTSRASWMPRRCPHGERSPGGLRIRPAGA